MCGQVPPKGSRKHGLQTPLQPYQILVWVTIASSILLFFFLCVPFIANNTQRGIYTGLYILFIVVGLTAFFHVSLTDPALKNGALAAGEGISSKSCTTCGSTMTPSTKHCYHCHKCVEGFDHHCLYLNTCIGSYNYTSFYLLISCLSSLVLLQSCVIALLLATYDTPEVAANTHWTVLSPKGYMVLLAATAFIPMGGFLLILSLLGFHAWIICWGITTYNWILDRRQKTQAAQDAKATKKFAKLQAEEQKTLITKEGNKTVIVEPTATGITTTTITTRPSSPAVPTNTSTVSSFPLQANSLLTDNSTPSTKPSTVTKRVEMTPVSIHTPSPASSLPAVSATATASPAPVSIHINNRTPPTTAAIQTDHLINTNNNNTISTTTTNNSNNNAPNQNTNVTAANSHTPHINSSANTAITATNTHNHDNSTNNNGTIILRPLPSATSTSNSTSTPIIATTTNNTSELSSLSSHVPLSHTSVPTSLSSPAPPHGVTVVEITPRAVVRKTSTSIRRDVLPDPDLEDESNALIDHRAVGEDHRASVSVELPLSYLGIDLGEKPQRRYSRTDSTRQSV